MSSRIVPGMEALIDQQPERLMPELELALLRRGMTERTASHQACARCSRTPLVGERVYLTDGGAVFCALCRSGEADDPARTALVHGPQFGHSIKLLGRRAA